MSNKKGKNIQKIKIECWMTYMKPSLIYEDINFDFNEKISIREKINSFFERRNYVSIDKKFYYLCKGEKLIKILDPVLPISQISKNEGDRILMSNKIYLENQVQEEPEIPLNEQKIQTNPQTDTTRVYSSKKTMLKIKRKDLKKDNQIMENNIYNDRENMIKISSILITIVIILGIITLFLVIFLLKTSKKPTPNFIYENFIYEILKANIIYSPGDIYLFKMEEKTNVISEGKNITKENSTYNFSEYKYFLLMIEKEYKEISNNNYVKFYYDAIFCQINNTLDNGTNLMISQKNKKVINILDEKFNLRRAQTQENDNILDYSDSEDNSTEPFFKLQFYRNGNIKNIYT